MELTANAIQEVARNANVQFTDMPVSCNSGNMTHRAGSGLITLRGNTCQCRARYLVTFGGNVAIPANGTVSPITLAIAIDGESIGSATMITTPAATGDYFNVSSSVYIDVPRECCLTVSVKNIGATAFNIQNANLIAKRVA